MSSGVGSAQEIIMKNRSELPLLFIALLAVALTAFSGCGSRSATISGAPSDALSPVSLSITDAPPAGVTVFSFELTLISAVLNPGSIDLLAEKGPLNIEVKRLETETALINTTNVPPGAYTNVALTFVNPQLTFRNDTGGTLTVGGTACINGSVCEVNPSGSLTATVNLPAGGGALAAAKPAGFIVDVNLANLFKPDMTLDFRNAQAVSLRRVPLSSVPTGQVEKLEEIQGIVEDEGTTANHFTLQTAARGNLDVQVNTTTLFDGCSANDLSCIQNDQAVEVDLGLLAGGVLYARRIAVTDDAANAVDDGIEGFIYQIDDATHFRMVTLDFLRGSLGIVRGRRLDVKLQEATQFQVGTGGLTLPPDIQTAKTAFESATDTSASTSQLQVGQQVQVRFLLLRQPDVSEPMGLLVLETNRVRLTRTRFTAAVASTAGSTFTVNTLPPVFSSSASPVTSIQVSTSSDTEFENTTGVGDLSAGALVSLRGFLFRGAPPRMFADKVRLR
jgi:Domain of unknown function (DUF5666)